jgi:hypothetical protein
LAASGYHDAYYAFRDGAAATTGGTSASTPVFARILTLLNQYLVSNGIQSQPGLGKIFAFATTLREPVRTVDLRYLERRGRSAQMRTALNVRGERTVRRTNPADAGFHP